MPKAQIATDVLHEKPRIPSIYVVLLLILLTVTAYSPAFNAGFIFDDHILIEKNPSIRQLSNLPRFFVSKEARIQKEFSDLQSDIYRPLQMVSYSLSYSLWKGDARFFHIENILIHIVNGILLYILVSYFFKEAFVPFIASLLFLLHPVQIEAVTYLSERADILAVLFCLLSFLAFIRYHRARNPEVWYTASVVLFAASLFSKEVTVTYPLILMAYVILIGKSDEAHRLSFAGAIKIIAPYVAVAAAYLIIRTFNLGKIAQTQPRDLMYTVTVMPRVFFEYLKLIFWPARLTFYHDFDIISPKEPSYIFFASVITSAAFLCLCLWALKRNKKLAFLLVSYLIALAPVSDVIPMKVLMQERFLYLPSIFLFPAVAAGAVIIKGIIMSRQEDAKVINNIFIIIITAVALALTSLTFHRNMAWASEVILMTREKAMHQDQGIFDFDIGVDKFRQKEYNDAARDLESALKKTLSPIHKTMSYSTLGDCYAAKGDFPKAISYYEDSLAIIPNYVGSLNALGHLYFQMGEYEKARHYFEQAVAEWPDSPAYNKNLGCAYIMLGDKENALKYWRRSLSADQNQPDVAEYIRRNE